ncbi:hypothetical protein VNO78_35512 [Psophocarpus tetragonolobus]|uniref:Uncharacterized protein n=1 Tax=Psophocarpus tetragonolobus TaxID=3891 RepID=A0AAN9RGP9_PSOTE
MGEKESRRCERERESENMRVFEKLTFVNSFDGDMLQPLGKVKIMARSFKEDELFGKRKRVRVCEEENDVAY